MTRKVNHENPHIPSYIQLKQILLAEIASHEEQIKLPSIRQLMSEHSVSQNTVDKAIFELEKEGMVIRKGTSGIFSLKSSPADPLAESSLRPLHIVGILVYDLVDFFPQIVKAAQSYLAQKNMIGLVFSPENRNEGIESFFNMMKQNNAVGYLLAPSSKYLERYKKLFKETSHAVMLTGSGRDTCRQPYVSCDNYLGGKLIAEHFYQFGHRHVSIISTDNVDNAERIAGFAGVYENAGCPIPKNNINMVSPGENRLGELNAPDIKQMMETQKPTAIFVTHDVVAVQLFWLLSGLGYRVPDDVSLAGFNNSEILKASNIDLTTVAQPFASMGANAAEMLCQKIQGVAQVENRALPVELVEGKTTAQAQA